MSMAQMQQFLNPVDAVEFFRIPREHTKKAVIPYFVYGDYFTVTEFTSKVPSAFCVGLGWLNGWAWHINQEGEPNIRFSTITPQTKFDGPVISGGSSKPSEFRGSNGTFGVIFAITAEDWQALHKKLESKTSIILPMMCTEFPGKAWARHYPLNVAFHWDPRNTRDGMQNIWADKEERAKWTKGMMQMRLASIPEIFIRKIQSQLMGNLENIEPFQVAYHLGTPPALPPRQLSRQKTHLQHLRDRHGRVQQTPSPPSRDPDTPRLENDNHSVSVDVSDYNSTRVGGVPREKPKIRASNPPLVTFRPPNSSNAGAPRQASVPLPPTKNANINKRKLEVEAPQVPVPVEKRRKRG